GTVIQHSTVQSWLWKAVVGWGSRRFWPQWLVNRVDVGCWCCWCRCGIVMIFTPSVVFCFFHSRCHGAAEAPEAQRRPIIHALLPTPTAFARESEPPIEQPCVDIPETFDGAHICRIADPS